MSSVPCVCDVCDDGVWLVFSHLVSPALIRNVKDPQLAECLRSVWEHSPDPSELSRRPPPPGTAAA